MTQRMLAVCLVLAAVAPVLADTIVLHVPGHCSPWRGGYNASPSHAWLTNWPNANSDGVLAEFDRVALQNAINNQISTSGGWNAKVIVTQVEYGGDPPIPANLGPVVVSVDVDPSSLQWLASTYYVAGGGPWRFGGDQPNFVAAVNAGVAAGKSYIADNAPWQAVWKPANQQPVQGVDYWDIVIDVPEYLLVHYLNNTAAEGLFVGAKLTGSYVDIYGDDQWGRTGDIRVLIAAPPTTTPWLHTNVMTVKRTIAKDNPTTVVPVTVTNAGSGTLAWTAAESPDVAWVNLTNASGAAGGITAIRCRSARLHCAMSNPSSKAFCPASEPSYASTMRLYMGHSRLERRQTDAPSI